MVYNIAKQRHDAEFEVVDIADYNLPYSMNPRLRCMVSILTSTRRHGRARSHPSMRMFSWRQSTTTADRVH